ncbi:hypothetical protein [Actinacidiphila acididurans]|uniref:Energy-coupling factor transporter transmembrane protein EcfT n=1 Tax=Actinacidiphila acididurans TaxID=2784346 RepID=A0ABS2TMJ5_9ACTN|nr:hypothetical protein [Actinacidiphila acididurans]MBM9504565.1 hypothetical protein [Actinacidiphila acididurans]
MDLARIFMASLASLSLPAGFSWYKKHPIIAVTSTLLYSAVAILPARHDHVTYSVIAYTVIFAGCLAILNRPWPAGPRLLSHISWRHLAPSQYVALAVSGLTLAPLTYEGRNSLVDHVRKTLIANDRPTITASGALIAILGSQYIIGRILRPQIKEINEKISRGEIDRKVGDFVRVGSHVGWIERSLLFAFLVSGNPDAAALVVAAKSLARLPGVSDGGKLVGDYYLIGTLTSVVATLLVAATTRLALGLSPL